MLFIQLDGRGALYQQLHRALREAILERHLAPDQRLPSTRTLAAELKVSRNTVLQAVEHLMAEGYVAGRVGSGTYVASVLPRALPAEPLHAEDQPPPRLSDAAKRMTVQATPGRATWAPGSDSLPFDFRYGEPAYADLPIDTWSLLLGRRARRLSAKRLSYQAPGGSPELREALAAYLGRARGVVCVPDQVIVTNGSQQAIDLTARLLVNPGDPVVLEEPHYTGFSYCLHAVGAQIHSVPVDDYGLRTPDLEAIPSARLVCVTPSHQYPQGSTMSLQRRLALLDWAVRRDAYILEDDYDGEFRFEGKPIESLQSLDRNGRVIYVGTASKMLFPALRIGWVVAPTPLVAYYRSAKALGDTGTPPIAQQALADFISEGHLERHVRRARIHAGKRRSALLAALHKELPGRTRALGANAGLHLLLQLPEVAAEDLSRLREACRQRGVGVYPATQYYERPPAYAEFLLGYASLDQEAIGQGVALLREAIDSL